MRQGIRHPVYIACEDVDLNTLSELEVYVHQGQLQFTYKPVVTSAHEMYIMVPKSDALRLRSWPVRIQFAFLDETGAPDYSNIVTCDVDEFMEEGGYGPD